jgi:uncharacterized membrane protein
MLRRTLPLSAFFVGAGILHFTHTRRYEPTIPPWIPAHRELVLVSGAAEIAGGVAASVPRLRPTAGWALVALLIAVFPANVYMAIHPEEIRGLDVPRWLLWVRLPLQAAFIAWALWATRGAQRR